MIYNKLDHFRGAFTRKVSLTHIFFVTQIIDYQQTKPFSWEVYLEYAETPLIGKNFFWNKKKSAL